MSSPTPGRKFWMTLKQERPLQIAGAINAYSALLAARAGFRALYLSGAGVANHSHGIPDIGDTTLADVLTDARRITKRVALPLLVDIDTGWDDPATAVREMAAAGVAAVHIEDQVPAKKCGHLPGKQIVPAAEMVDRVRAAVSGKPDRDFVVMARTDAAANEGVPAAIARAQAYVAAGADMIFAEALHTLDDYKKFTAALALSSSNGVNVPVLANLTEFGQTPYFTLDELRTAGIAMVLYPLSASRAAAAASLEVYSAIRKDGTQKAVVGKMQTRTDLYDILGYDEKSSRGFHGTTRMSNEAYTCPCCGHCTLPEPVGSYEICPVCFWEDDLVQLAFPNMKGGANRVSLIEGQQNFAAHGVCELAMKEHVRPANAKEPKDLDWKPYNSSKHRALDSFSKTDSACWNEVKNSRPNLYYWQPDFWRAK